MQKVTASKKFLIAFLVGFGAFAIPRILDALDAVNASGNFHFTRSLVVSFFAGAVGAGLRGLIMLTPFEPNKNVNP